MNFDFNKLDSYKAAIDDGFVYKKYSREKIFIRKAIVSYVFITETKTVTEENWEVFKKRVADYFLENN